MIPSKWVLCGFLPVHIALLHCITAHMGCIQPEVKIFKRNKLQCSSDASNSECEFTHIEKLKITSFLPPALLCIQKLWIWDLQTFEMHFYNKCTGKDLSSLSTGSFSLVDHVIEWMLNPTQCSFPDLCFKLTNFGAPNPIHFIRIRQP